MMEFFINDFIRTSNKVLRVDLENLKKANIKPGTKGEIIDIIFKVKFGNTIMDLHEDSLNYCEVDKQQTSSIDEENMLHKLMDMMHLK